MPLGRSDGCSVALGASGLFFALKGHQRRGVKRNSKSTWTDCKWLRPASNGPSRIIITRRLQAFEQANCEERKRKDKDGKEHVERKRVNTHRAEQCYDIKGVLDETLSPQQMLAM